MTNDKIKFATSAIYNLLGLLESTEAKQVLSELNVRFGHIPDLPKVYDVSELAKRWKLHVNTVRLMMANDPQLGAFQEGRKWLVRHDSLEAYERTRARRA